MHIISMSFQDLQKRRIEMTKIVGIYVLFGIAWIYGSDSVLGWLVHDPAAMVGVEVFKGSLFILCTAILLYFLINRFVQQLVAAESGNLEMLKNYQAIFNATNEAIFIHNAQDGTILDVNDRMLEIFGYDRAEALTLKIGDFSAGIPPYSQAEAVEKVRRAVSDGPQVFEWLTRRKTGELFWSEVSLKIVTMNGQDRITAVVRDISERKIADQQLAESHKLLDNLAQMVPGVIYQYRLFPDGRSAFPYASQGMNSIYEVTPEEVREDASPVFSRLHPEDHDRVAEAILKSAQTLEMFYCEFRVILPKQGLRWRWSQAQPQLMEDGSTLWHGIISDITERKQAEEEVQRNELRLKKLVDILQHPAETLQELLDYALEQAIQLTGSKIGYIYHYHEETKQLVLNSWSKNVLPACTVVNPQTCYELEKTGIWGEAVRQRQPVVLNNFQTAHPLKKGYPEGHVELLKFVTIPIFKAERIVSVVGLANKVTDYDNTDILQISLLMDAVWKVTDNMRSEEEKLKLKAQLLQAQKMEAIGTLAGGIAHDFNNILSAILGYTEIACDSLPPGSVILNYLDKVLEASQRASNLVKQILAFSRQESTEYVSLQPSFIIKEAIEILRSSLPSTITIKPRIDSGTKSILADPTQLHQVLMNLCTNAFHAMEKSGGILEINLEDREISEKDLKDQPGVQPGNFVVLSIKDSGQGIPPEIRDKIFDPYFTTKDVGKGTGMGLSIVHGIIKKYGGFIICESTVGTGTVFKVYLPSVPQEITSTTKLPIESASRGKECILFVDDEEMLTALGKVMLERLGYEVVIGTSSLAALEIFLRNPNRFDAVITDQTMPGMTGIELAEKIMRIRPDLPIILCTGYSTVINEDQAKGKGIRAFAMKPLSQKGLATILRDVLDQKSNFGLN